MEIGRKQGKNGHFYFREQGAQTPAKTLPSRAPFSWPMFHMFSINENT